MLLAVDQGTTNTKAMLIDAAGHVVFRASSSAPLHREASGNISQDPAAIWHSVREVLNACSTWASDAGKPIAGLCLTNQRETAVAWDRTTGAALAPAISWQCRRSAGICEEVRAHAPTMQKRSGLPLDPLLSATKWAWMLRHEPQVAAAAASGTLAFGTVDAWLLFCLTGRAAHATDATNASRTGLLDLECIRWDAELLRIFGLQESWLPGIHPSADHYGLVDAKLGLGELPIVAVIGDSHAAMAGHGDFRAGAVKATYGTGSSLMALTASVPAHTEHLARTIAWSLPHHTQYALEGNITMSGAALEWVGSFLGLDDPATQAAALAQSVEDSDGLAFVPAMAGLGAPHWRSNVQGTITGLRPHHRAAHLAYAALEAIAMQVADVAAAMGAEGRINISALRADGGATRNAALMQLQADALGVPVLRSSQEELSALGAARLGGLTLGWWPDLSSATVLNRDCETFSPLIDKAEKIARHARWNEALQRTLLEVTS